MWTAVIYETRYVPLCILLFLFLYPILATTGSVVVLLPVDTSQVLCACDRIGSYKFVGWCQSRHLLDVIFENNREAAAALIDIEVSCVTSYFFTVLQ